MAGNEAWLTDYGGDVVLFRTRLRERRLEIYVSRVLQKDVAPTALEFRSKFYPALTRWANLCRASGADLFSDQVGRDFWDVIWRIWDSKE